MLSYYADIRCDKLEPVKRVSAPEYGLLTANYARGKASCKRFPAKKRRMTQLPK